MLSKKLASALNEQIKFEFESAYYYLSMASYLLHENLNGSAGFMKLQAQEELGHGMKFYSYLQDQGHQVMLPAIDKPRNDFKSLSDIFEQALANEKKVSKLIYDLMALAHEEKEYATISFLKDLVDEQVEEENTMNYCLDRVRKAGDAGAGLLFIDAELGKRTSSE